MPKRASKSQPAVMGNLSQSKRAVVTKTGAHVLNGREVVFLSDRELDALEALRREFAAQSAAEGAA